MSGAQFSDASTTWPSVFPALRQSVHGRPLTYLDSAATTLRPQSVIDALVQFYSLDNANPSRVHTLASRAADRLAAARQTVARFVNAADASEIVFVRGTTEGVNLVASAWGPTLLSSGDEIVISIAEHSSNLMPWTRLARERGATVRVVDVTDEGRLEPHAVRTGPFVTIADRRVDPRLQRARRGQSDQGDLRAGARGRRARCRGRCAGRTTCEDRRAGSGM